MLKGILLFSLILTSWMGCSTLYAVSSDNQNITKNSNNSVEDSIENLIKEQGGFSQYNFYHFVSGFDQSLSLPILMPRFSLILNGHKMLVAPGFLIKHSLTVYDFLSILPTNMFENVTMIGSGGSIYDSGSPSGLIKMDLKNITDFNSLFINYKKRQHDEDSALFDVRYVTGFSSEDARGVVGFSRQKKNFMTSKNRYWANHPNPKMKSITYQLGASGIFDVATCKKILGDDGVFLNNQCLYNTLSNYVMDKQYSVLTESVFVNSEIDLSDDLKGSIFFGYAQNKSNDYTTVPLYSEDSFTTIAKNKKHRRLVEFGKPSQTENNHVFNISFGLSGLFYGYKWSSVLAYSAKDGSSVQKTVFNSHRLNSYFKNINLLQPLSLKVVDDISGLIHGKLNSNELSWSLNFGGALFEMPSGMVLFETYTDIQKVVYTKYFYETTLDGKIQSHNTYADLKQYDMGLDKIKGLEQFNLIKNLFLDLNSYHDKKRTMMGVGAMVSAPLTKKLKVVVDGRIDRFDHLSDKNVYGYSAKAYYSLHPALTFILGRTNTDYISRLGVLTIGTELKSKINFMKMFFFPSLNFQTQVTWSQEKSSMLLHNILFDKITYNKEILSFSMKYSLPSTNFGELSTHLSGEYIIDASESINNNIAKRNMNQDYRLLLSLGLSWTYRKWNTSLNTFFIDSKCSQETLSKNSCGFVEGTSATIKSFTQVNLSTMYTIDEYTSVQMGVENLFDRAPSVDLLATDVLSAFTGNLSGRTYFLSFNYNF